MSEAAEIAPLLEHARGLAARGEDAAAKAAYLEILRRSPTHFSALNELGTLAHASNHRAAARTAYEAAVRHHPGNPIGHINLGNLLYEEDDPAAACEQYRAALAIDAGLAEAHQGLARALADLGETEAARHHFEKGFAGRACVTQLYRGPAPGIPLLLLVSAMGGNIPTRHLLDDRIFAVTALYTEVFERRQPLPPHALVLNAIGDADLCGAALMRADDVLAHTTAPVINRPGLVRATDRAGNARRLATIPGAVVPDIRLMPRSRLRDAEGLIFPLLLRAPGFHTGKHFLRVLRPDDLAGAVDQLLGDELLVIGYLDGRGADGLFRKYRVMFIDGRLYPLHLAISADWKVHYFTSDAAQSAAHREEERCFLTAMASVLGAPATAALSEIGRRLGLDYAGIDFGLGADGSLLFFEANATMVIAAPDANPIWDYRRASIEAALDATRRMLLARATA